MIFQHTWQNIIDERKTQTRRVISPNEVAIRTQYNQISAVLGNGRLKWKVGQTYAVQTGRGKPEIARIRITGINSENVSRISSSDAKAEGFANRHEFFQVWQHIHGENALHQKIWVIKFELVGIFVDRQVLARQSKSYINVEKLIYAS